MALLTAQGIARVSIPILNRSLVLPRTFTQVPSSGFAPPNGETVTVRLRAPRTARTQATPGDDITYDGLVEIPVTVSLDHKYNGVRLSDEEISLELEDFAMQVTQPQAFSVAEGAEDTAYAAINGAAADATIEFALAEDPDDTDDVVKAVRQRLSENRVPTGNRFLAVAPDIYTRLLGVDKFVRADAAGDGRSSALRDAIVGSIYGFTVIEAVGLDAGTAFAYHRSGAVFSTKRPSDMWGTVDTATIQEQGIAIRSVLGGDINKLSSVSVLSTFAGSSLVFEDAGGTDNDRWIKVGTSSV